MPGCCGRRTSFAVDPGTTSPLSLMAAGAAEAVPVPAAAAPVPAAAMPRVLEEAGVDPRMLPPVSGLFDEPAINRSLQSPAWSSMGFNHALCWG